MSSELTSPESASSKSRPAPAQRRGWRNRAKPPTHLSAHGEPMIWLTGGALSICLAMIVALLSLVLFQGGGTFWPSPLVQVQTSAGQTYLGEFTREESYRPTEKNLDDLPAAAQSQARKYVAEHAGLVRRRLMRTGNFELTQTHFHWIDDYEVQHESLPEQAVVFERLTWGRFYGTPVAMEIDGKLADQGAGDAWNAFLKHHVEVRNRWAQKEAIDRDQRGSVSRQKNAAHLAVIQAELDYGKHSAEYAQALETEKQVVEWAEGQDRRIRAVTDKLNEENRRYQLVVQTADGKQQKLLLADIVRAYPANRLGLVGKLGVYFSRWWEFVSAEPRDANNEGGVFPAIFGTVVMTVCMSLAVVPFGVLAALYLREYARGGLVISIVRIAVNNLAGVPSIVFGVFGFGFFCYLVGGTIDEIFFPAATAEGQKTFNTGGMLWASLTLALLTLPVVIVATEEALAAVPRSMREGSYACGASKWQTIWHIVLPRAMPGIMTGMILAMARGAGEVAPLMLVGAVKIAPSLVVDGVFPYFHPQRAFMHLGFHIYDVGFQSQNSEAARPMVYTTTLLLITIVITLNVAAIWLRARLRRQYQTSHF